MVGRGRLMTVLGQIRSAYQFHSPKLNNFCDRLEEAARQKNTRWYPDTNNAHRAAFAALEEVATQLGRLREEALSRYPRDLTQKRRREMNQEAKEQLNAYLVCKPSCCRQDCSNLTVRPHQAKVEPYVQRLVQEASEWHGTSAEGWRDSQLHCQPPLALFQCAG